MNKFASVLLLVLLALPFCLAIVPGGTYTAPEFTDTNGMGAMLVQEWAFGSIDVAFLLICIVDVILLVRFQLPMSIIAFSVMGWSTLFGVGFSSIFAWGFLIIGIITISLLVVLNILYKSSY
jgi:hypothetical protein